MPEVADKNRLGVRLESAEHVAAGFILLFLVSVYKVPLSCW